MQSMLYGLLPRRGMELPLRNEVVSLAAVPPAVELHRLTGVWLNPASLPCWPRLRRLRRHGGAPGPHGRGLHAAGVYALPMQLCSSSAACAVPAL